MIFIKRKSAVKLPEINGSVVDTFNVEDKTTNAPSIRAVEEKLVKGHGNYNSYRSAELSVKSETATGIKVNLDTTGGDLLVFATLPVKVSNYSGYIRVYVDGVNKGNIGVTNKTNSEIHSFSKIITGIASGSHTVEIYVLPDPYYASQNPTITVAPYQTQSLSVIEL